MHSRLALFFFVLPLLVTALISPASAAWVEDGSQVTPYIPPEPPLLTAQTTPDGSGGNFTLWYESRGSGAGYSVYMQRLDRNGTPQWKTGGILVHQEDQYLLQPFREAVALAGDGSGYAFIAMSLGETGIYDHARVYKIDLNGDHQWGPEGISASTYTSIISEICLECDGAGGVVISWVNSFGEIHCHRISGTGTLLWGDDDNQINIRGCRGHRLEVSSTSGTVILAWTEFRVADGKNAVVVQKLDMDGTELYEQYGLTVSSALAEVPSVAPAVGIDGSGNPTICWSDSRVDTAGNIYAQRVTGTGTLWDDDLPVCVVAGAQEAPEISVDASGFAKIVWEDSRNFGSTGIDLYAQKINTTGIKYWGVDGFPVSISAHNDANHTIAADGSGNLVIVWEQDTSPDRDIQSQLLDDTGNVGFSAGGEPVCMWAGDQYLPSLAIDESTDEVFVSWIDERTGRLGVDRDAIYSQKYDNLMETQWIWGGAPVVTSDVVQDNSVITSLSSGGAVVVWRDFRGGTADIHAQKLDALGNQLWEPTGLVVGGSPNIDTQPRVIDDGSGGVFLIWKCEDYEDSGSGLDTIVVQHLDPSGNTLWPDRGIHACAVESGKGYPQVVSDCSGGVIITWLDKRHLSWGVFAQRLDASGTEMWTAGGVNLSESTNSCWDHVVTSDGEGGAIICWAEQSLTYDHLYAQKVGPGGALLWTPGGVPVCTMSGQQRPHGIVTDGAGGAIMTWHDPRDGNYDVYAQRIDSDGTVLWTTEGEPVCTESGDQGALSGIISDGVGGAIIAWSDYRTGTSIDLYSQRVGPEGDMLWTSGGVYVGEGYEDLTIDTDGENGAVIGWSRYIDFQDDIYAQRISSEGTVLWDTDGTPVCTESENQHTPCIASDGGGGAFMAWTDLRDPLHPVIYAQRVGSEGIGPICSISPLHLEFPDFVEAGIETADSVFTICNEGIGTLDGDVTESSSYFSVVSGGGAFSLAHGESVEVAVRYEPLAWGRHFCLVETGAAVCSDVTLTGKAYECPAGGVLYVHDDKTSTGSGDSWGSAINDLPMALEIASLCTSVTDVWVREGTYTPDDADRSATFQLTAGVKLRGGFAGTESSAAERSIADHETTLSGDIGTIGNTSDNSYHIVTGTGVTSTAWLDGFTVTGGNADGDAYESYGAGMFNLSGDPTINDVIFEDNYASLYGGAVYNNGSSPQMTDVIFRRNSASYGGAIYSSGGSSGPYVKNALFYGNTAATEGGALYSTGSSTPIMANATFTGNEAGSGGAAANSFGASLMLVNVIMYGDTAAAGEEIYNTGFPVPATANIYNSLVEGCGGSGSWNSSVGTDQGGNIDDDPGFVNTWMPDLHILSGSPVVDAGTNSVVGLPSLDLDGESRVQGSMVDMGAYEGEEIASSITIATIPAGAQFSIDGNTFTAPQTLGTSTGSEHEIEAAAHYISADSIYLWDNWSDAGDIAHPVTMASGSQSYTATFLYSGLVDDELPEVPAAFALHQNVPNPFNPVTRIAFDLPAAAHAKLQIYNVKGELVSTLVDGWIAEGSHDITWDGRNRNGANAASGVYFYRLSAGRHFDTKKMVLVR